MTKRATASMDAFDRRFVRRWRETILDDMDHGGLLGPWISFCFRCGWIAGQERKSRRRKRKEAKS